MNKISIPYKASINKNVWDYMTQTSAQLNNINLAQKLEDIEASIDNIIYVVLDGNLNSVNLFVALSNQVNEESYKPYCNVWTTLNDCDCDLEAGISVFSFDIKKYNSVLSFSEDYQSRDKISFYANYQNNKLYYCVDDDSCVDLSPLTLSQQVKDYILYSYNEYKTKEEKDNILNVESVDKNSFLMPFMSYKDFLNFATYSINNSSMLLSTEDKNYFINSLVKNNELLFYCRSLLRKDKFNLVNNKNVSVPTSLWQILVMLQHFKFWTYLQVYNNSIANLVFVDNSGNTCIVKHLLNEAVDNLYSDIYDPDLSKFELVGEIHSNELFKLNKLYSTANRTCYFDFSNQTFTGNNYVFNDNKLDTKTVDLTNKIQSNLPLRITFTEIKHYIGSDLSQKNFNLRLYTDGVRVMLERWNNDFTLMDCRVIFNHEMSKRNQNL